MKWHFSCYSPQETLELGAVLGSFAPGGAVFALHGDLGAGKTLLAKGVAQGLQVREPITSPTFTIVNQYLSGRLPLNHMDIYRIQDEDELWEIGIEEYFDNGSVAVVEWPEILGSLLPEEHIVINIKKEYNQDGKEWRTITIEAAASDTNWLEEALRHYEHTIH